MKGLVDRPAAHQVCRNDLLAAIAHELRGPLAIIASWAQLLRQRELDEGTRRAVEIIHRSAMAQGRLIDDLVDHADIALGNLRLVRERVDAVELARSAVDAVRPMAREGGVEMRLRGGPPAAVQADPVRLRQVLHNLLTNAIRYSPSGSLVELEVAPGERQVMIRVRDSGIGITPAFLPYVFERYRREGRSPSRGLGLGLAIARAIVELHGGTIAAESPGEGRGATFTVMLPADDQDFPLGTSGALAVANG
jgi:signal transduction histidine kinase